MAPFPGAGTIFHGPYFNCFKNELGVPAKSPGFPPGRSAPTGNPRAALALGVWHSLRPKGVLILDVALHASYWPRRGGRAAGHALHKAFTSLYGAEFRAPKKGPFLNRGAHCPCLVAAWAVTHWHIYRINNYNIEHMTYSPVRLCRLQPPAFT